MRAHWSWRVTAASIAFLITFDARAQAAPPPAEGGTETTAPRAPDPGPAGEATPLVNSPAPEAAVPAAPAQNEVSAEPVKAEVSPVASRLPPKDEYPNKGLKPQKFASHYGFAPNFHWEVVGFYFYGLNIGTFNNKNGGSAFGVRTHLDFGHLAFFGQFERFASDSNGSAFQFDHGKVMVGVVPTITPYGRFRILAGMDILSNVQSKQGVFPDLYVSPIFGLSGRLGNGMFGLDVSSIFGIYPLFQADIRAAFVIRLFFAQIHLGYQLSYRSAGPGTSPGVSGMVGNGQNEVQNGPLIHGPQVAFGFGW